jgi:DMSO/TMAO reductase YedYZ molybdopterin-dependent catalytic subunit
LVEIATKPSVPARRSTVVTTPLRQLGLGALFGVLSAGTAIGVGELVAAITGPATAPELAVGSALINLAPVSAKEFAIREFGTNDKPVLVTGVLAVLAVVAAVAGILALRRKWLGVGIVLAFGIIGMIAAGTAPTATAISALPSLAAAIAGVVAMLLLFKARRPSTMDSSRRAVLLTGGAITVVAAASAVTGLVIQQSVSGSVDASRARIRLPRPSSPATLPPGYRYGLNGLTPFVTPTNDFYRVDTSLSLPRVPTDQWSLLIHGMTDRQVRLSFADVLAMPLVERYLTLSCVSNDVGGPYVGTARWLGVPLTDLLRMAGVRSGAEQLLSRSIDGMTIGSPTEIVTDGRDALLAVAMNGEPLPIEHGFPARLIVPGSFGYASATKWVVDLELTTFASQAYWAQRGYDRAGTVKTGSRIDIPRPFAQVPAGPVTVAGVAYCQHKGISAVQLRFDGGPWQDAEITTEVSIDTWRQWRYRWQATPGPHRIEVRAADGRGDLQPEARAPIFPSGATGWDSLVVTVTT